MQRFIIATFLIAALFTGSALAATSDPFLQGQTAFKKGLHKQALTYLLTAFSHKPDDPNTNFLLGRTYFELGRYEDAIMSFERVLFVSPDSSRVKLELARAYLALGSKEFARQYFQEVLATHPPEAVLNNIRQFLETIEESEQRHFFTGTLTVGLDYDDNPRTAPSNDTISLGSLEFQLSGDGSVPEADLASAVSATLNHVYRPVDSAFSWKTGFLTYNSFYQDENDLNINYFEINSGPSWKNATFLWQNNLLATAINVDQERYLTSYGFSSALTSQLFDRFLVTGKIRFEDKDNKRFAFRSANNYQASAQAAYLVAGGRLAVTYGMETEDASNDLVNYDRKILQVRLDTPLPRGIAFYVSAVKKITDYEQEDPLFAVTRNDELLEFSLGFSKSLWEDSKRHQNLFLALSHKYTDTESNIDLYTYQRHVTNLSLTFAF